MPSKLLIPKPMVAIEPCAICGRAHVDPRNYRRCAVCKAVFCWQGRPRGENIFGVERRLCGSRRHHSDVEDPTRRLEYRCRRHTGTSWIVFGSDWIAIRPIAVYLFLCVAFSVAFWGFVFLLVSSWLRHMGIG
jgi:hypothetical protein